MAYKYCTATNWGKNFFTHEERRQFYLAAQWIIDSAKKRSGSSMSNRLAGEILSASNNEGSAIKKKEDTHRMAEANKAFAHFGRGR